MAKAGHDPEAIELLEITDQGEADREGFIGSPTIRVDGEDVEEAQGPTGLACRVYRRPDGRASPLPDPDAVGNALMRGFPVR
jgi:hypothetical protein